MRRITLSSAMNLTECEALRTTLLDCLASQTSVEIGTENVTRLSTWGIQVLISARHTFDSSGLGWRLVDVPDGLDLQLRYLGLGELLQPCGPTIG